MLIGVQNLLTLQSVPTPKLPPFIWLNFVGWLIVEGVFIRYVILPPIILWGIVVVVLGISGILALKNGRVTI